MNENSIATIVQTAVLAITLIVFSIQVRGERKATQLDAYSRCQSDYSSVIRMLVEKPELSEFYDEMQSQTKEEWEKLSAKEKMIYNYLELNYELMERVYILRYKNKWIDDEDWKMWDEWLRYLCKHRIFAIFHTDAKGMFNPSFQNYIDTILSKK